MRITLRSSYTALNTSSLENGLCESGMEDVLKEGWDQVRLSVEAAR